MTSQTVEATRASSYQIIKQPVLSQNGKDPYSQPTDIESTTNTEDCCNDLCRSCCECLALCCGGCLNFNEWLICCWIGRL